MGLRKSAKTYNSGYSPVVSHLTTDPPVKGLSCGEQTRPRVVLYLWSYVEDILMGNYFSCTVYTKHVAFLHMGPAKKLILGAVANPWLTTSHKIIAPPSPPT